MRPFKNEHTRKQWFDTIIENHVNGHLEESRELLKALPKVELVRLASYALTGYNQSFHLGITKAGEISLFPIV